MLVAAPGMCCSALSGAPPKQISKADRNKREQPDAPGEEDCSLGRFGGWRVVG